MQYKQHLDFCLTLVKKYRDEYDKYEKLFTFARQMLCQDWSDSI